MIKTVQRDEIRMLSGQALIVDPIRELTIEESSAETMALPRRLDPIVRGLDFMIVEAYQRIDSVLDKTPVLVNIAHVETIRTLFVQVDVPDE